MHAVRHLQPGQHGVLPQLWRTARAGPERLHRAVALPLCGNPNAAFESLALGCPLWITGIMNVVPRSARQMLQAMRADGDLARARDIYYTRILPLFDLMFETRNPTGTIKAGLRARGVDVGVPRRPGSDVGAGAADWLAAFTGRVAAADRG